MKEKINEGTQFKMENKRDPAKELEYVLRTKY